MNIVPAQPKIYHIVHVDRLSSIVQDGFLWCDAEVIKGGSSGTSIGIKKIKQRRRGLPVKSHSNLHVGKCVPFYFCPKSVMLFVIYKANDPELTYRDGQSSIIHLQADLHKTIEWIEKRKLRWAFTTSSAALNFFQDYCDLSKLGEIDWAAVNARQWGKEYKKGRQAEFLVERRFAWHLIESIGVYESSVYNQVANALTQSHHKPSVALQPKWYY